MFEHGQVLTERLRPFQDVWADLKYEPREGSTEQDTLAGVWGTFLVGTLIVVFQNMAHPRKALVESLKNNHWSITYVTRIRMMCILMRSGAYVQF